MSYITDRKRAEGLGAAHTGTKHHWFMLVTSFALIPLCLIFIFLVGRTLGEGYLHMLAVFHRPLNAVIAFLTMAVGLVHFNYGCHTLIQDYARGKAKWALITAVTCLSYGAIAIVAFALIRIAL